jgi:AraC family transcriptional regulator, transcriptional activator of pobA
MAKKQHDTIAEYHLNRHQPDKPQFAIYDLKSYLEKNTGAADRPHIHSYYQIIWFQRGKGTHFVDFKAYDVADNAIFFIAKSQVHYFDESTEYEGILIHFSELFFGNNDHEMEYLVKRYLFNNPYQRPSCCIGSDIKYQLEELVKSMKIEISEQHRFGQEELLRAYLTAFLIQVQRRKNEIDQNEDTALLILDDKQQQLIHFVNLVEEYFNKGLSVAEYAGLLHISTRTLSDITARTLNKTPSLMIQERIVLEAQRSLLHSNLNVNQIAYRLGFDDPSYFVKYFKKHAGISPSEFRKSIS